MATMIIAEAGVNHNGDMNLAKELILQAKKAGADYVKFQTFQPEKLVSRYAPKAEYQKKLTGGQDTQLGMLQKLALSQAQFCELYQFAGEQEIGFISAPFDIESIHFLNALGMEFWKIPSGEITNLPYLEQIGDTGKPIILSTGMSTMDEVKAAISVLRQKGTEDITILHCNTEYPTPMQDVNLRAMQTLREQCQVPVGYSDHTLGIEVPIAAVAMGAIVIEKHFTLDHSMEGPDHKASLEPDELTAMVKAIRNIESALGDGNKQVTISEKKNMVAARKSIVAARTIEAGEIFTTENLTTKRPGNGISPMNWYAYIGQKAKRHYEPDELIDK